MALQSIIDRENGPVDAMQVVVTVYDDGGADVSSEAAVARAQLDAPVDFFGVNQDVVPSVERIAPYAVAVSINYRYRQLTTLKKPIPQETNTVRRIGGPFSTARKFMKVFLSPLGVFSADGDVTAQNDATKWQINMIGPGNDFTEPGAWIEPLKPTRTLEYTMPTGTLTDAYQDAVEALVESGAFNNAEYLDRPAGELQLVYFDVVDRTADDVLFRYGFGWRPLKENLQVSNTITIPELYPTDYFWLGANQDGFDPTTGVFQRVPRLAYVGQVWPTDNFATILNLPGIS